ncbi:TetR family transcriptional regulator C-terminal domain-containing protein [Bradyrhizobium sp.]|jgi:TetR/AcrR family transcriptional regulator, transcriptional repressor for nem operon|uniref:TetR/AcrR family transcriptional regulator n=1 Tax=Bradyrhizobium sp. TaxID=376 RepID=UPI003C511B19
MARPSLREKLASSAVDTLHTFGFKGCSIQDITEAAGVPKGSFFNHFENKEDLAIDSLRRYLEGVRKDMLFDESVPPLQRLKNHFNYLAERLISLGYGRGCMMSVFAAEMSADYPKMREELRSTFENWCDGVTSVLREAQAKGEVDPRHDPVQLARFLVNAWQGATIRLKITQSCEPIDDFLNVAFKALLK